MRAAVFLCDSYSQANNSLSPSSTLSNAAARAQCFPVAGRLGARTPIRKSKQRCCAVQDSTVRVQYYSASPCTLPYSTEAVVAPALECRYWCRSGTSTPPFPSGRRPGVQLERFAVVRVLVPYEHEHLNGKRRLLE